MVQGAMGTDNQMNYSPKKSGRARVAFSSVAALLSDRARRRAKVEEISYLHAEGYPAGELKHGPIAMLDPTFQ